MEHSIPAPEQLIFLQPVLEEYLHDYPQIPILLRGDSGFSMPDLYKQYEERTIRNIWEYPKVCVNLQTDVR